MSDDFLDDNVKMNTLFHLLGNNQQPELKNRQINELCIKVLINFKEIYADLKIVSLFDKECLKRYKFNLNRLFNDCQIDLDEMQQYSENQYIWVEFLTLVSMLRTLENDYFQANFFNEINEINENIVVPDKTLRLRLNLFHN
ncbi:hypothetical protein [Spiroplasma endosymbiont of Cantharis rufa]|uniref:hypothetical protein n=1 Tax=Spiroplasma endosymbiont of Cantharis rufa TaxID=3066279 RepID=UPI0030D4153A